MRYFLLSDLDQNNTCIQWEVGDWDIVTNDFIRTENTELHPDNLPELGRTVSRRDCHAVLETLYISYMCVYTVRVNRDRKYHV